MGDEMNRHVPIRIIDGVELHETARAGIRRVEVSKPECKSDLPWDRFVRLKATADTIRKLVQSDSDVLDVGGYDGALALFLPEYNLELIDPATTGASFLHEPAPDRSYDLVAAVDILEHIVPADRQETLKELARVARNFVVLNYPCTDSKSAQELMLKLTHNTLIKEHVQWELPDSDWVVKSMDELGYRSIVTPHTSVAVWLGQYLALNLLASESEALNQFLVQNHANEPFGTSLYHLVVCERIT